MRILLCLAITLAVSCGVELKKTKDTDEGTPEIEESVPAEKLQFEGYVQTAFEVTVDGIKFQDTENFYTRFRQDLIQPNYPEYADKEIEILGEYSHSRFGSRSPVYMSPMADSGHQFYAVTDGNRHFKVTVDKAGDQQYRAKIILRIGLQIEEQKLCYLLHSTKNDIVFQEGTPIIFNDFQTQLNTFECEDAPTPIEIPAETSETPETTDGEANPTPEGGIPGAPEVPKNTITGKIKLGIGTKEEVLAAFGPGQGGGEFDYHPTSGVCADATRSCAVYFKTTSESNTETGEVTEITSINFVSNILESHIERPVIPFKIKKGLTLTQLVETFGEPAVKNSVFWQYHVSSGVCVQTAQGNGCFINTSGGVITGFSKIYSKFTEAAE